MNKKIGKYGALLTEISVLVFSLSMIVSLIKESIRHLLLNQQLFKNKEMKIGWGKLKI